MTTVYELLRVQKKGAAYKSDQIIDKSWLHIKPEIQKPVGAPAGRSRVYGDVDEKVQDRIIDILIEVGSRYKLSYRDIAHMLLLCRVESGFNPDAAAGTTSAAGLGQYTAATVKEAAKEGVSKKRLSFILDLSDEYVFDAERGAYGVVLSYMICKEKSINFFGKDFEKHLYLFHHEGWYFKPTKEHMAEQRPKDVIAIISTKILPHLDDLEKLLSKKTELSFKLITKDDKPYPDQPYVAVIPSTSALSKKPSSVQNACDSKFEYILGKTDANGKTQSLTIAGLTEVLFIILNFDYKLLLDVNSNDDSNSHTVAKDETLTKIAKDNGTTVKELQEINHIADPKQLKVGQNLQLHKGEYLWRRPPMALVGQPLQGALHTHPAATEAIVEHKRSHIVLPDGNQAQQHEEDKNVVVIRGGATSAKVTERKAEKDVAHTTVEKDINKKVEKKVVSKGTPIKEGLLFPLPIRPTADYHGGARKFNSKRGDSRRHGGCDLYAPVATEVRAMADGVIVRCHSFYWHTDAIEVHHGDFIIRYGELAPLSLEEQKLLRKKTVKRGDLLGKVGQLIRPNGKKFEDTMLHLEIYGSNESPSDNPLTNKSAPFQRRSDLIDPTATLDKCVMS